MKIGIVTTWQERGAAYVSRQYRDLLKKDHEVFIYARGGEGYASGDKNWDDGSVTWGQKIPIHMPAAIDLADFKKWLLKNKLEIIFFNEQQWWDPVLLCQEMGIKTGAYIDYYTPETVPFFKIYDFLTCNTLRHYDVFKWHPGAAYISWGTDINLFRPIKAGLANDNLVTFFHSAGFSPERKGTDLILRAFARILGQAKLIIHTQIDLKKAYPDLADLISSLLKNKKLELYHKTVPAPGLYHLGDVYVYPSRLDGLGLSLPEALACGLALITSDNSPMKEFFSPEFGRLIRISYFKPRSDDYYWPIGEPDEEDLCRQLQYYANNPELVKEQKIKARAYAENNLDWAKNAAGLTKIFSESTLNPNSQEAVIKKIKIYESKRSNWQTRLYRKCPLIYRPLAWFWPLIKRFYQQ